MECAGGNYNKPTKADSYEEKLIAMVRKGGRTYLILWENGKFPRPARYVVAAEAQAAANVIYRWLAMNIRPDLCLNALEMAEARAAANIMGEEMSGIVEGTTGPALGTDTAVLRRSVDMATYTS